MQNPHYQGYAVINILIIASMLIGLETGWGVGFGRYRT